MKNRRDSSYSRSPVSHSGERASVSTLCRSEDESFVFAYWLGVDILLEGLPCITDPKVIGTFKRLLNAVLESDDCLGFIEACSWCRSVMMTDGTFYTDVFKRRPAHMAQMTVDSSEEEPATTRATYAELPRWVRGLASAIDKALPGYRFVHPSVEFNRLATFFRVVEEIADSYSFRAVKRGRVLFERPGIVIV